MDIDGFVEVNNRFLFIEGKSYDPRDIPVGQFNALTRLSRQPYMTVILLWGDPELELISGWNMMSGGRDSYYQGDTSDFQEFVKRWFEWADSRSSGKWFSR